MPDAVIFLKRLLLVLGINAGLYLLIAYYPVWRYDFSNGMTESNLLIIPNVISQLKTEFQYVLFLPLAPDKLLPSRKEVF